MNGILTHRRMATRKPGIELLLSGVETPAFFFANRRVTLLSQEGSAPCRIPLAEREAVREAVQARTRAREGQWMVGAFPFDRTATSHLLFPEDLHVLPGWAPVLARPERTVRRVPASKQRGTEYAELVRRAREDIRAGLLEKVVLARDAHVALKRRPALSSVLAMMRARSQQGTTFAMRLPESTSSSGTRILLGMSPEWLVSKRGRRVTCLPLAGSCPRGKTRAEDERLRAELAQRAKDLHEHRLLTEQLSANLAPWVESLAVPEPEPIPTAGLWHLATRIEARTVDSRTNVLDLVLALHPSAAVCGVPRAAASQAIAELESMPRGFYGGALGYMDPLGDGEWVVTIRCAELEGKIARLFAGAGIVAESDPLEELEETEHKMAVMHDLLAAATDGGPDAS